MSDPRKESVSVEFAKAIADSTRQKIMKFCCCEWRSVTDIAGQMGVTQPTVSHHLAILRDAGLVDVRPEGKQTFYRLDQKRIVNCCGVLEHTFAPGEEDVHAPGKTRR
jgi:DNA-binding transcriptional ArsR family regulator